MVTKITDLLKSPISLFKKQYEVADRISEMNEIKEILQYDERDVHITACKYPPGTSLNIPFLKPTPELIKIINEYLNNRLVELAQEVQILQGVAPIEHLEYEYKDEREDK
mgnify:CR=1 FL=1